MEPEWDSLVGAFTLIALIPYVATAFSDWVKDRRHKPLPGAGAQE